MSRPIREPAKLNKRLRFLQARRKKDVRFADICTQLSELGEEFVATASMIEDAAAVVAYNMRKVSYAMKQSLLVEEIGGEERDNSLDNYDPLEDEEE